MLPQDDVVKGMLRAGYRGVPVLHKLLIYTNMQQEVQGPWRSA